ncbi:dCMP cyt deam 1 domain containing protein, partial [Asbolus verrucosus]
DSKIQHVLREAVEARNFAYCPYSKFQVGACLLCEDDSVYRGCNIENAAFTVGICAERAAFAKAIGEGKLKYKAIAVIGYQETSFTTPCGACRQFMSEFGNIEVYIAKPELDDVLQTDVNHLLPHQFEHSENHTF